MERRIISPPSIPPRLGPLASHRPEHVSTHDGGTYFVEPFAQQIVIQALIASGSTVHLSSRSRFEDPFVVDHPRRWDCKGFDGDRPCIRRARPKWYVRVLWSWLPSKGVMDDYRTPTSMESIRTRTSIRVRRNWAPGRSLRGENCESLGVQSNLGLNVGRSEWSCGGRYRRLWDF